MFINLILVYMGLFVIIMIYYLLSYKKVFLYSMLSLVFKKEKIVVGWFRSFLIILFLILSNLLMLDNFLKGGEIVSC